MVNVYGLEAQGVDTLTGAYIINSQALDNNIKKLQEERRVLLLKQKEERNNTIQNTRKELKNKHDSWDGNATNLSDAELKNIEKTYKMAIEKAKKHKDIGRLKDSKVMRIELYDFIREQGITDDFIVENIRSAAIQTAFDNKTTAWEYYLEEFKLANIQYHEGLSAIAANIQDNIISDMYDVDFSNESESFFRALTADFIEAAEEEGKEQEKTEKTLKEFFTNHLTFIEQYLSEEEAIQKRLVSKDVALSDYQDLINNNIKELQLTAALYGEKSDKYQELLKKHEENLSKSFGSRILGISNKTTDVQKKSDIETFGATVLQNENAYNQGTRDFEDYIANLNKAVQDLDISTTFKDEVEDINNILDLLNSKASEEINYSIKQFKNGSISIDEYLNQISGYANYYTTLVTEMEQSPLVSDDIKNKISGVSSELTTLQTDIGNLRKVIPLLGKDFDSFSKLSDSQLKTFASTLKDLGVTTATIGGKFYETAEDIAGAMQQSETAWAEGQDAIELKTQQTLGNIGKLVGRVMDGIAQQINGTTFGFKFTWGKNGLPQIELQMSTNSNTTITDLETFANREAGLGVYDTKTGEHSNKKNMTQEEYEEALKKRDQIIDDYTDEKTDVKVQPFTGIKNAGGRILNWLVPGSDVPASTTQDSVLPITFETTKEVKKDKANEIFWSNLLAETGINSFSFNNISPLGDGKGTDSDGDGTDTSELEKYYAVIFQDYLSAILEDRKEAIADFEKKNDDLNDDLAHALELRKVNNAQSIYSAIKENKKEYETALQEEIEYAEATIANALIPAINELVPQFAISNADEMTNLRKQQITDFFETEKNKIEQDLHYLEQLKDEDLSAADKKTAQEAISDPEYLKDVDKSIILLEDRKNALEYTEEATNTNISTLDEFTDSLKENNDKLKESQRDISAYKTMLDGLIDVETERIETAMEKYKISGKEAVQMWTELYNVLQTTLIPESLEEAAYKVEVINDTLKSRMEAAQSYYEQIYSDAGTIKDYEVGLLEDEIDAITTKYDEQIEALEEKRRKQEETNDLIEAENRLRNLQKEKNKRVYREGLGFVWEADEQAISEARNELENLKLDKKINDLEKAKDAEIKAVQDSIDKWEEWYKELTREIDRVEYDHAKLRLQIDKDTEDMYKNVTEVTKVYEQLKTAIEKAWETEKQYNNYNPKEEQEAAEKGFAEQEYNNSQAAMSNYKSYLEDLKNKNKIEVYDENGNLDYAAQNGEYKWANETLYAVNQAEEAIRTGDEKQLDWAKNHLETSAVELVNNLTETKNNIDTLNQTVENTTQKQTKNVTNSIDSGANKITKAIDGIDSSRSYDDDDDDDNDGSSSSSKKSSSGGSSGGSSNSSSGGKTITKYSDGTYTDSSKPGQVFYEGVSVGSHSNGATVKEVIHKNAKGTINFEGGLSTVGEEGMELAVLPRGTGILPNPITEELWKFGANPVDYLTRLSLSSMATKGETKSQNNITNNEYTNIGTVNLPNVQNAKQFVQELKLLVKRTKNT